jgi:transposase
VRYRKSLVEEHTRELNRIEKVLEGANIKLAAVASTLSGKGVRDMLRALVAGETDTERLAERARGRMRSKREELARALRGAIGPHQRFMLGEQVGHLEELERRIERVSREIEERLGPFERQLQALETIPGVGRKLAEALLAEVGSDMSRFPTSGHLASWAGLCPGSNESGGRRKSGRTRKGNRHVRSALVEAAHAASHARGTYLAAQYHRLAGRRGKKRAAVAVAHSILVIAYHLLRNGGTYHELGANYFDELKEAKVVRRLERRLQALGYEVTLEKKAA